MSSFFQKFSYKIVFVLSILYSIVTLFGIKNSVNIFLQSSQHGAHTVVDLFGFLFSVGTLLGFLLLSLITYSYIRNRTQSNRLSHVCAVIIGIILILILLLQGFILFLLVISGGFFALIPGATQIISPQMTGIVRIIFYLAFIGLLFAFSREHTANKLRIFLLWLIVFVVGIVWFVPQYINKEVIFKNSPFLESPTKITTTGSIIGWKTYEDPQMGISFMYPPSWPTPSFYGSNGNGNPYLTIQETHKPMIMDIEIGQKTNDRGSCANCVVMNFDDAISSFGPYLGFTSPNYKISTVELKGNTYVLFTPDSSGGNAKVFIPNKTSPNNYAVINFNPADLDTLYLFLENFRFIGWSPPVNTKGELTLSFTTNNSASSTWQTYTSKEGGFSFKYPTAWGAPKFYHISDSGFAFSQITIDMGKRILFMVWSQTQYGMKAKIKNTMNIPGKAIIDGKSYVATYIQSTNSPNSSPQLMAVYVQKNQSNVDFVRITADGYIDAQTLVNIAASLNFSN